MGCEALRQTPPALCQVLGEDSAQTLWGHTGGPTRGVQGWHPSENHQLEKKERAFRVEELAQQGEGAGVYTSTAQGHSGPGGMHWDTEVALRREQNLQRAGRQPESPITLQEE